MTFSDSSTENTEPTEEQHNSVAASPDSQTTGSTAEASPVSEGEDSTSVTSATPENMGSTPEASPTSEVENSTTETPKKKSKALRIVLIVVAALIALVLIAGGVVLYLGKAFTASETAVRSSWSVETGDLIMSNETYGVDIHQANTESDLTVVQLVPTDVEEEGFTYYNTDVQTRLVNALSELKSEANDDWTADNPLAVLNPFGTATNELYLYFETELDTQISYTIHVDDESIPDYTATANNTWLDDADDSDKTYTRKHEFQIIGLVPGETNEVTLTVTGSWGTVRQIVTFSITMPETTSEYATSLSYTEGESTATLSDGLYAQVRTGGYQGYMFFYDNSGIMRYEMVLEGYGFDRILEYEGDLVVCASSSKMVRIDGIGRVTQVYELGDYDMHHDLNYTDDEDKIVILAEHTDSVEVEDIVLELDLATGEVTELLDFTELMSDYADEYTRIIGVTDTFFWQAGEHDWIHLNTIDSIPGEDSIIVSSRETSTIIKVSNVHTNPEVAYLVGDSDFWVGTTYESRSLTKIGDFVDQYGQHSVEYDGAYVDEDGNEVEGCYYIMMYNNNYWALCTRDNYTPSLDASVGTSLYGDDNSGIVSSMYRYLINENDGTYELVDSFEVPYSSIVSNVSYGPNSTNYVVNSGISNVFGEYDEDGVLIREFSYDCTLQTYRVFKLDFVGFWFAE